MARVPAEGKVSAPRGWGKVAAPVVMRIIRDYFARVRGRESRKRLGGGGLP